MDQTAFPKLRRHGKTRNAFGDDILATVANDGDTVMLCEIQAQDAAWIARWGMIESIVIATARVAAKSTDFQSTWKRNLQWFMPAGNEIALIGVGFATALLRQL